MFSINKENKIKDVEKDALNELSDYQKKFREGRKKEENDIKVQQDPNFFTCIIFQTKEQAEEFNEKIGQRKDDVFIDGLEVAKFLGIEIESETPKMPKFRVSKSYNHLT